MNRLAIMVLVDIVVVLLLASWKFSAAFDTISFGQALLITTAALVLLVGGHTISRNIVLLMDSASQSVDLLKVKEGD